MSYGRSPYYIYQGEYDDETVYFHFFNSEDSHIPYDQMAQLIASMWWRDNKDLSLVHGELRELIERGLEIRPQLKTEEA